MSNRKRLMWFLVKATDKVLESDTYKRVEVDYLNFNNQYIKNTSDNEDILVNKPKYKVDSRKE